MTKKILMSAMPRTKEEKVSNLRENGELPAVIYGPGYENRDLKINYNDFEKIYAQAGGSNMIDLSVGEEDPIKILIKDVQVDYKGKIEHIDLYKFDAKKKITASIPLNYINEEPFEKMTDAILVTNYDALDVDCFPNELMDHIEVDLSAIKEIGDSITIADLKLPETFSISQDDNDSVASLVEQRIEKEPEKTPAELEEEAIEKSEKEAAGDEEGKEETKEGK